MIDAWSKLNGRSKHCRAPLDKTHTKKSTCASTAGERVGEGLSAGACVCVWGGGGGGGGGGGVRACVCMAVVNHKNLGGLINIHDLDNTKYDT